MKVYDIFADMDVYRWLDSDVLMELEEFTGEEVKNWKPLKLEWQESDLPLANFIGLGGLLISLDSIAKKIFEKEKIINVQLLPLEKPQGYEVINITNVIDAIDYKNAEMRLFSFGKLMMFTKYAFKKELVYDEYLFKIPEFPKRQLFATDKFKSYVEKNGLTGIRFIEVWDSEKSV